MAGYAIRVTGRLSNGMLSRFPSLAHETLPVQTVLWGELPEDAIQRELSRGAAERCARALVEAANREGGRDNITVLVAVLPK